MKKIAAILVVLTLAVSAVRAQQVVPGQNVPKLKAAGWLDNRIPAEAQLTYIEFYHPSNPGCIRSLERLCKLVQEQAPRLRLVVVTQACDEQTAKQLRPLVNKNVGVVLDPDRVWFQTFEVQYVPFGVLYDARNRVLWMGNSLQLTAETIADAAASKH